MPHESMMTPFYQSVLEKFIDTQQHQIDKGAEKYPEPFNPHSWTTDELLEHGMQEAVDLMTYLVGMSEKVRLLETENKRLQEELIIFKGAVNRLFPKPSPFEIEFAKAPYADLDD